MAEMVNDGALCRKEIILPILLSNPILFVPDDDAYKNWILVGLDLDVPIDKLQRIKKWGKTKGTGTLHGIVAELIEEWMNEQARIGERASVRDLVSALEKNNLTAFGEALESAFQPKHLERKSTLITSAEDVCISTTLLDEEAEITANEKDLSSTEIEDAAASTSGGAGAHSFWPISPTSSVSSSKSWTSSFSYVSVNYEKGDQSPSYIYKKGPATEILNYSKSLLSTTTPATTKTSDRVPVSTATSVESISIPIPEVESASLLDDKPYSPSSSYGESDCHSADVQGSLIEDGELVPDTDNESQQLQLEENDELLQKLKSLQETVQNYEKLEQQSLSRSSRLADNNYSRNKRKYDDFDDEDKLKSNKRHCIANSKCRDGGFINETDRHGLNRLHRAVKQNRMDEVNRLISGGADVNEPTDVERWRCRTPLHLAAHCIRNRDDAIEMIKLLIDNGAKLDVPINANYCRSSFIDALLSNSEFQPISSRQFHKLVEFLISRGHSKFLKTHLESIHIGGRSALHLSMKEKILGKETVELLQRNDVNLNRLSTAGNSLLFYAICGGRSIKMIKYLIDCCNVNWRLVNRSGWNVLHMAARHRHEDALECFLKLDRSLMKRPNGRGDTPLDFVKEYFDEGNHRVKKILEKQGIKVNW